MRRKILPVLITLCAAAFLAACGGKNAAPGEILPEETRDAAAEYIKISPEETRQILDDNPDAVILDVRTREEFAEKRIGGAVLLPHTDIESDAPDLIPDKNAVILVYCRTGIRSEAAANALAGLGYAKVYDIGGIEDWPYETVSGEEGGAEDTAGITP